MGRGCRSPREPEADRIVGPYLAPFSGISHKEQEQPSRSAPSKELGSKGKKKMHEWAGVQTAARGPEHPGLSQFFGGRVARKWGSEPFFH